MKKFWCKILNHEKILNNNEAIDIIKEIKESRKDKGFRE